MATKKKPIPPVTITPKVPAVPINETIVEDLFWGECFLWDNKLMMKVDGPDQQCVSLMDGDIFYDMCDHVAIPVNVEIKWTKRP